MGMTLKTERLVTNHLTRLGIPRNIRGYEYIKYAICICIEDFEQIHYTTKGLYPCVALKFGTTPSCIERSIRHAIETGWSRGEMEFIEEIFGYSVSSARGKPTNSAFIATIADEVRLQLKKE